MGIPGFTRDLFRLRWRWLSSPGLRDCPGRKRSRRRAACHRDDPGRQGRCAAVHAVGGKAPAVILWADLGGLRPANRRPRPQAGGRGLYDATSAQCLLPQRRLDGTAASDVDRAKLNTEWLFWMHSPPQAIHVSTQDIDHQYTRMKQ